MYDGIDVSVNNGGDIYWRGVRKSGCRFAMIKASQGHLLSGKAYLFPDRYFARNIIGAADAGLYCGSYHYLTAKTEAEAKEEAQYYLSVISPYRALHLLWAAVDVEEDKYLPDTATALNGVVNAFCNEVSKAGFIPMVYTNPNYIKYKFKRVPPWDIWLAQWRPKAYGIPAGYPRVRIWQYGTTTVQGINGEVDGDAGNFWLPDTDYKRG